jgi:hypothetical protein
MNRFVVEKGKDMRSIADITELGETAKKHMRVGFKWKLGE